MESPSRRADGGWHRPGIKALEALSLGICNNRTRAATSMFKAKKTFQHMTNPFEPIAEENLRFNPDPQYLLESLKICMLRLGPSEQIPLQHNYAVNILLEAFQDALRDQKAAKVEAEEAKKQLEEKEEAWSVLEADYKRELEKLEDMLAGINRGSDHDTLARTNSLLRKRREELSKATSNVKTAIASDNSDQSKDFRQTTSNLSGVITGETAKKDGLRRHYTKASNQVFDHKRISLTPNDKLLVDFGTIMDSQYSKTIQQDEDALAAASRHRWLEARRRAGHTEGSSSCGSSEGRGLGLTLYDRPMQPFYYAPVPTPTIVEPEGDVDGDGEADDDEGEELIKLPHGGYYVKPPKKRRARSRAKTLFGMGKKKVVEVQHNHSSSPTSSDSDDIGPGGIANAIANANFIATIASPMVGMDKTATPPHKAGGLRPPKHNFKNKKKTSYVNLPALAHHFMHGRQKHGPKDPAHSPRSKLSMGPNTKYDKYAADISNIMLSERRAFSESSRRYTNSLPSSPGYTGNGYLSNGMETQASPKFALDLPSQEALVEYTTKSLERPNYRDKAPMPQRVVSNLRHEHILEDDNESHIPTYNKSNISRESFKERKTDTEPFPPFLSRTSSSLGLEMVSQGQAQGLPSEQPFLHPYSEGGIATADAASIVSDRVYDPRIIRKPSPLPFSYAEAKPRESDQQHTTHEQRALVDRARSTKEERDAAETASRRALLRASGHKIHGEETASWKRGQPRQETFNESVVLRESEASRGGDRPSSQVSIVTALYNPRDSVVGDDRDDDLIRARSGRGGVGDALVHLTGNIGSSRSQRGPLRGAEHNTMPYSLSAEALLTLRERDEIRGQARRERGSVSSIESLSTTTSRKTKNSVRGMENFMTPLRNVMKPSKSKHVGKAEDSPLLDSKSPTNSGEVNGKDSAREKVGASAHDPFADPVDNSFISDTSGEGAPPSDKSFILRKTRDSTKGHESFDSQDRPVAAILQGPDSSEARPFSFAPGDERQFSTDRTQHNNKQEKEMPHRSLHHPFIGGEEKVHSIKESQGSSTSSGFEPEYHDNRPPGSFVAGDRSEENSDESDESVDSDDSDAPESRTTHTELSDTAAHHHEASRQEITSDGGQVVGPAPTTALSNKKSGERLRPPRMAGLQKEQTSLRRGGSGQYGRSGSRLPTSESVASLRKRMVEKQASREQATPQKSPLESVKPREKKPSHGRLFRTSSTGSIIAFFEQKAPQRPPPPPPKDEIDVKKHTREGSGQLGRDGLYRLSSGPRSACLGQTQASGEKAAVANAPINPAVAAARSVAEAAAKKKLAKEAEKKKLAEEPGRKKNKK